MNQFKRAHAIILAIDIAKSEYNQLWLCKNNILYNATAVKNIKSHENTRFQELYIISDDEIKEGDWIYCNYSNTIHQGFQMSKMACCKKIIATTDTSLEIQGDHSTWTENLPQPSQQFIEKYIESYNKDEVITDVLVEYEVHKNSFVPLWIPKINPKDNSITIKKLKNSWNREEVIELLHKLNGDSYKYLNYKDLQNIRLTKWIEVNL